jgi:membrane-bound lytic murein transglycosylase D
MLFLPNKFRSKIVFYMNRGFLISFFLTGLMLVFFYNSYSSNVDYKSDNPEKNPTEKRMKKDSIPIFPDLVYEYRIAELNNLTPIELEYNERVRRYIDVYTIERRDHLAKIIGLAEYYFPIFEEALDKYSLPLELKYLAIVESALDPRAISSTAAVGLWQFKINTSTMFDLEVNSYIDERCDPLKATEAACSYLEYLYRIFNDWQLALAAYNGGPGVVSNAIERSGGKTSFWDIQPFLPDQTKGYVPAFIAVNYAMNYYKEHNIEPVRPDFIYIEVDTVVARKAVSFSRISEIINVPIETLQFLNPSYRKDYIPKLKDGAVVVLPKNKIKTFIKNESIIFDETLRKQNIVNVVADVGAINGKIKIVHEVAKGEYFHKIAIKYNCTIDDIRTWNNLPSNDLNVGQKLDVWVNPSMAAAIEEEKLLPKQQRDSTDRFIYYTVQKGDTVWSIATKFNCRSITDLKEENNIVNDSDLKPGTKLKIYLNN